MWISAAMHRRTVVLPQPYGLKSIVIPVAGTESTRRELTRRRHAPTLARRFWIRINKITTQPRHACTQAGRAPVRMIVPTCAPRSAAVSRPGTSPFTSCTRSMWRAVAMTSISVRSNGSVPWCFARSAALVSRSNFAFFPRDP